MKVYKFGGASIKSADAVRNLYNIIDSCSDLIVVVSAIDKTTNALEDLYKSYVNNNTDKVTKLSKIINFHRNICNNLFPENPIDESLQNYFNQLSDIISGIPSDNFDFEYDRIVSFGEMFSSVIVFRFLKEKGLDICFLNIKKVLRTNSIYKEAEIDWEISRKAFDNYLTDCKSEIILTQGFIGSDEDGNSTTLGREGSDFTAAALAYMSDAEQVTIWKDVLGVMNADPAWCSFAEKLDMISYQEAIELAFYGAKVIHPKTIKPLENKNIPLFVKSFIDPKESGTIIKEIDYKLELIPVYILKENQTLISISPKDFSFIVEENISKIFDLFVKHRIKVNITQNSAISFSAAIDGNIENIHNLIEDLSLDYSVKYNTSLLLITVRHYNQESIIKMTEGKKILLEQRSRVTARFIVSNNSY